MSVMTTGLKLRSARNKSDDRGASMRHGTRRALREDRGYGWSSFRDVPLGGADTGAVDEVVIGPGGIFVIEHAVAGDDVVVEGGSLRRGDVDADELVSDIRTAAGILEAELPAHVRALVQPVLCLEYAEAAFGWSGDVMVCSPVTLPPMMNSRPPLVTDKRIDEIAEHLERRYPYEDEGDFDFDGALADAGHGAEGHDAAQVEEMLEAMRHADLAERAALLAKAEETLAAADLTPADVEAFAGQLHGSLVAEDVVAEDVVVEDAVAEDTVTGDAVERDDEPVAAVDDAVAEPVAQPVKHQRVAPKRRKEPTLVQRVVPVAVALAVLVLLVLAGLWIF